MVYSELVDQKGIILITTDRVCPRTHGDPVQERRFIDTICTKVLELLRQRDCVLDNVGMGSNQCSESES